MRAGDLVTVVGEEGVFYLIHLGKHTSLVSQDMVEYKVLTCDIQEYNQ